MRRQLWRRGNRYRRACIVGALAVLAAMVSPPAHLATTTGPVTLAFPNPSNHASLPTVAFVVPNLDNDMHDGSIARGDSWLYQNLSAYANWAKTNNSLLILTWDEDDHASRNQIPTVIYGANVRPGSYSETISHYTVLSTLEQMYGLPKLGYATRAPAITDIWGS